MDTLILVLEIIGTVAFAVSGALTGIRRGMDLFGVVILGVVTAVGGGAIRDVLIGITPPAMLSDPTYTLLSAGVSILMFIVCSSRLFARFQRPFDLLLFISDSLGLGCFSVYGVSVAYGAQADSGLFLCVFLGVITGVGGGVLRDIFAGNLPYIFTKHIYACASIVGALACALLWNVGGSGSAMVVGMVLVVLIRILAAHFEWDLPRAHFFEEQEKK